MGLATDYANKYRRDPFFRTEVNIIALQLAFASVTLLLLVASRMYLLYEIPEMVVPIVNSAIANGADNSTLLAQLDAALNSLRFYHLLTITAGMMLFTLIVGYVVSSIALAPARSALDAQKQFIGNVAHEIRTPLSIIKTNIEVELLEGHIDISHRKMLQSNIDELDRVSDIINNLLSLSSLVRPERIEFGIVHLGEVVEGAAEKLRPLAKRRDIIINIRASQHTSVWGNAVALEQIVLNLLKNAINFSNNRGRILIAVEPHELGEVELLVQDNGAGIARKDLYRIFEPFYRAEQSRNRAFGGSGLGLTIVSELVRLHRGKISVRSAPRQGTTVIVHLRAAHQERRSGTARDELDEVAVDFSKSA